MCLQFHYPAEFPMILFGVNPKNETTKFFLSGSFAEILPVAFRAELEYAQSARKRYH
jgi:hypothetical protein